MAFVATTQPDSARHFYADILGLRLIEEHDHAIVFDANGIELRIQKAAQVTPAPYTSLGWEVDALKETIGSLAHKGVRFEYFEGLQQDETGIWCAAPGVHIAWFKDPDGNLLSLVETNV
jgi:catechol 2,3-dioxygenase-like lactoylglutathione lyase family enzyme